MTRHRAEGSRLASELSLETRCPKSHSPKNGSFRTACGTACFHFGVCWNPRLLKLGANSISARVRTTGSHRPAKPETSRQLISQSWSQPAPHLFHISCQTLQSKCRRQWHTFFPAQRTNLLDREDKTRNPLRGRRRVDSSDAAPGA